MGDLPAASPVDKKGGQAGKKNLGNPSFLWVGGNRFEPSTPSMGIKTPWFPNHLKLLKYFIYFKIFTHQAHK